MQPAVFPALVESPQFVSAEPMMGGASIHL
jgi:hypothetical protein